MAHPRTAKAEVTRETLLRVAERLFLEKGYVGTSVDEICVAAGTTKGAFFYHFDVKEDLGLEVGLRHARAKTSLMEKAAEGETAQDRLYAYVDYLGQMARGIDSPACLVAFLTLELGAVNERFRAQCEASFDTWTQYVERLILEAVASRPQPPLVNAKLLARQLIAIFQGSLIMARAAKNSEIIEENLRQYRRYLQLLLEK